MRNTIDAIEIGRDVLGIDDLTPVDAKFISGPLGILRVIPYCHAENVEFLAGISVIYMLDVWKLGLAWTAP